MSDIIALCNGIYNEGDLLAHRAGPKKIRLLYTLAVYV